MLTQLRHLKDLELNQCAPSLHVQSTQSHPSSRAKSLRHCPYAVCGTALPGCGALASRRLRWHVHLLSLAPGTHAHDAAEGRAASLARGLR
jgi:hypothetical protein